MALPALLAIGGLSAAQGIFGGLQQRQQIKAQNKLTKEANRRNVLEAFQGVSAIEVQRGQVRTQTAKNLQLAGRMADEVRGSTRAAQAAAGVKGASVDATLDDIDREQAEVSVELQQQHITQEYDLNNRIRELMTGTRAGLGQLQKVPSIGSILLGGLVQGGLSAGSAYASQAFKFGSFGSTSTPGGTYGQSGVAVAGQAGFRSGVGPGR